MFDFLFLDFFLTFATVIDSYLQHTHTHAHTKTERGRQRERASVMLNAKVVCHVFLHLASVRGWRHIL